MDEDDVYEDEFVEDEIEDDYFGGNNAKSSAKPLKEEKKAEVKIKEALNKGGNSDNRKQSTTPSAINTKRAITTEREDKEDEEEEEEYDDEFEQSIAEVTTKLDVIKTQNKADVEGIKKFGTGKFNPDKIVKANQKLEEEEADEEEEGGEEEDAYEDDYEDDEFDGDNKSDAQSKQEKLKEESMLMDNRSFNSEINDTYMHKSPTNYLKKYSYLDKLESIVIDAKSKIEKSKNSDMILDRLDYDKKFSFLSNENKYLRTHLQRLNDVLNSLISRQEDEVIKAAASKKEKARKAQSKIGVVRMEDQRNNEKILRNLRHEHFRLAQRLEQIKDPEYLFNLRKNMTDTIKKIKELQKSKKELELYQFRREKKMGKIIEQDEPDAMKKVNHLTTQLTVMKEKILNVEYRNDKLEEIKQGQMKKEKDLLDQLKKLKVIAQNYDIDIEEISNEDLKKNAKLLVEKEKLEKVLRTAKNTQANMKKSYENRSVDMRKKMQLLKLKRKELQHKINDKQKHLQSLHEEMSGMMNVLKKHDDNSASTATILKHLNVHLKPLGDRNNFNNNEYTAPATERENFLKKQEEAATKIQTFFKKKQLRKKQVKAPKKEKIPKAQPAMTKKEVSDQVKAEVDTFVEPRSLSNMTEREKTQDSSPIVEEKRPDASIAIEEKRPKAFSKPAFMLKKQPQQADTSKKDPSPTDNGSTTQRQTPIQTDRKLNSKEEDANIAKNNKIEEAKNTPINNQAEQHKPHIVQPVEASTNETNKPKELSFTEKYGLTKQAPAQNSLNKNILSDNTSISIGGFSGQPRVTKPMLTSKIEPGKTEPDNKMEDSRIEEKKAKDPFAMLDDYDPLAKFKNKRQMNNQAQQQTNNPLIKDDIPTFNAMKEEIPTISNDIPTFNNNNSTFNNKNTFADDIPTITNTYVPTTIKNPVQEKKKTFMDLINEGNDNIPTFSNTSKPKVNQDKPKQTGENDIFSGFDNLMKSSENPINQNKEVKPTKSFIIPPSSFASNNTQKDEAKVPSFGFGNESTANTSHKMMKQGDIVAKKAVDNFGLDDLEELTLD